MLCREQIAGLETGGIKTTITSTSINQTTANIRIAKIKNQAGEKTIRNEQTDNKDGDLLPLLEDIKEFISNNSTFPLTNQLHSSPSEYDYNEFTPTFNPHPSPNDDEDDENYDDSILSNASDTGYDERKERSIPLTHSLNIIGYNCRQLSNLNLYALREIVDTQQYDIIMVSESRMKQMIKLQTQYYKIFAAQ